jgi:hypothetical protein
MVLSFSDFQSKYKQEFPKTALDFLRKIFKIS